MKKEKESANDGISLVDLMRVERKLRGSDVFSAITTCMSFAGMKVPLDFMGQVMYYLFSDEMADFYEKIHDEKFMKDLKTEDYNE